MPSDEDFPEGGNRIKLNKLLKDSVFAQDIKRTYFYLEKGADASLRVNIDAGNLLHHNRDPFIAAALISKGAKVDARNRFRLTPLYMAVNDRNYDLVTVLLNYGADVQCFDKRYKNTPLNIAVIMGDVKLVKLLLEHGSVVNDQTNFSSNTPLHLAAYLSNINVEIINLLLENGADVNILNHQQESPFHRAVKNSYCPLHVLKKLIDHGAFTNTKDMEGGSPFQFALDNDNYEVVKLLLKHDTDILSPNIIGFNMLHYYITSRHAKLKIVKCLLKHSCTSQANEVCYANALTPEGVSPLILALHAVPHNEIGIIKELLHYNADPLLIVNDQRGKTTMFDKTLHITESETDPELLNVHQSQKDIINFRKKKELSRFIMKWMIKYSALKSNENVCFMQSKLKEKHYFNGFLSECLIELPLIEQELGISLNELLKPASLKNTLPNHIVDKIIQILTTGLFPIYKEVVAAILKRSDLLNRLKYEMLNINTENGQTYFFNWTVTCHFVKYLRTKDLLNLFVAFYTPAQK